MLIRCLAIMAIIGSFSHSAFAQNTVIDSLFMMCAEIENPPQRYACYDNTAAKIKQGADIEQVKPNPAPDTQYEAVKSNPPEAIKSPKKETVTEFGLFKKKNQATKEEDFGKKPDIPADAVITQIEANIRDFSVSQTGVITVLLDNGQIWRQLSGDSAKMTENRMKRQTNVTTQEGALGSYRMTLYPSQKSIRVKRIK